MENRGDKGGIEIGSVVNRETAGLLLGRSWECFMGPQSLREICGAAVCPQDRRGTRASRNAKMQLQT